MDMRNNILDLFDEGCIIKSNHGIAKKLDRSLVYHR